MAGWRAKKIGPRDFRVSFPRTAWKVSTNFPGAQNYCWIEIGAGHGEMDGVSLFAAASPRL